MILNLAIILGLPTALRAIAISSPTNPHDAVVQFTVSHRLHSGNGVRSFAQQKRSSTVLAALDLNDHWIFAGGYFVNMQVGTPPQSLDVLLDTGSSDLFLPSAHARNCQDGRCLGGSFSSELSSSFDVLSEGATFRTQYVDGSTANGRYATERISIGHANLDRHVFALADEVDVSPYAARGPQYGILGLSFQGQEASVCASADCDVNFTTPTILDSLLAAGHISTRSYSLYLDDQSSGQLLFGGIDTSKFTGQLVSLAVQKDVRSGSSTQGLFVSQDLRMISVSNTYNGSTWRLTASKYSRTAIIDSGTPALHLPPAIYNKIINLAPVILEHDGSCAMLCKHANSNDYVTIGLMGANGQQTDIRIPYANLLMPIHRGPFNDSKPLLYDGEEVCVFAIARGSRNNNALGDPLLRSVYTVFNLDEQTISFAQARHDGEASRIEAISPG